MTNKKLKIFQIYFAFYYSIYVFSSMKKAKTGRKKLPEAEKTVLVGFYTKRANVERAGGMTAAREKAKEFIESVPA